MLSEAVPAVERDHRSWSSLPDAIFADIICRLGITQEAVITVSPTSFIIKQKGQPIYNIYEFWTALDNFVTVFIPPFIDTFTLDLHTNHYDEPCCWPIIDRWARQLRACKIQHFTANGFRRCRSNFQVYPLSFFQIHSLVSLKLNLCDNKIESSFPRSILLPNLKKLTLLWINYGFLKQLLSRCPSLEDLCLSVDKIKEDSISLTSKKLKRLHIMLEGRYKWYLIKDFIIDAPILEIFDYSSYSILSMRMLDSISNVKSLTLLVNQWKIDRGSNETIIFPNLTHLHLTISSSEIFKAIGLMLHCPKLVGFELHLDRMYKMLFNQEAVFVPVKQVKHIKLCPSMHVDPFGKEMLDLVTLLLRRSAKVLKKLTLITEYDPLSLGNHIYLAKPQFYRALFECVKATSRCQVEFLGLYKRPNKDLFI